MCLDKWGGGVIFKTKLLKLNAEEALLGKLLVENKDFFYDTIVL